MVANHSQKKQARALMEESGNRLNLTEAMAKAEDIRSSGQGGKRILILDSNRSTLERIGEEIRTGRDILVFGATGSGKTSVLWRLIHWAKLKTLLITGSAIEAVYAQGLLEDLNLEARFAEQALPETIPADLELVCFDDLRQDISWPVLEDFRGSRIVTIHGQDPKDALLRLQNGYGSLGLTNPLLIETKMVRTPDGRGYGLDVAIRNF